MMALTFPRFRSPRQIGTRRHVGLWSAPIGAIVGDVRSATSLAVDVEIMTGSFDYGQPTRSNGAGSVNGGRTP